MPRIDRLVTLYLSNPLAQAFGSSRKSKVPILMYHSISENLFGMSHPYFHINTPPEIFARQMRWLHNAGYRTIGLDEALNGLQAGADLAKSVVLTFDDGYRDFYDEALPILKQHGFTATLFLVSDRIGNSPVRIEGADFLTWGDVRELQNEGIHFGSHTVTHPDMRCLAPEQLEYELGRSKEVLEDQLGVPVDSFSHPHGFPEEDRDYARFLQDVLCNCGYDHAVSTIIGRANANSNRFFLPRLPVNSFDDQAFFLAKLKGGYDWLHWPQLIKKMVMHNSSILQWPGASERTGRTN